MKRITLFICLTALIFCSMTPLAGEAVAASDPYAREMYHVMLVKQGPKWEPMGTDKAMEIQSQMLIGLQQLDEQGILVTGGIVNDASDVELILIMKIETLTDAQELVRKAPSVQSGFYKVEMYPWFGRKGLKADPPRQ